MPPRGARLIAGRQKHLERGVRENNGAHVAAVGDQPRLPCGKPAGGPSARFAPGRGRQSPRRGCRFPRHEFRSIHPRRRAARSPSRNVMWRSSTSFAVLAVLAARCCSARWPARRAGTARRYPVNGSRGGGDQRGDGAFAGGRRAVDGDDGRLVKGTSGFHRAVRIGERLRGLIAGLVMVIRPSRAWRTARSNPGRSCRHISGR